MKCQQCSAEVSGAKFCSNCGSQMLPSQSRTPDEVDREWLWVIMERLGYRRDKEKENEDEAFGSHAEFGNLTLALKRNLGVIAISRFFRARKAGWGKSIEQLRTINKANGSGYVTTWFFDERNNLLGAYSFVPLTESLTEADVVDGIERYRNEIRVIFRDSGVLEYLAD